MRREGDSLRIKQRRTYDTNSKVFYYRRDRYLYVFLSLSKDILEKEMWKARCLGRNLAERRGTDPDSFISHREGGAGGGGNGWKVMEQKGDSRVVRAGPGESGSFIYRLLSKGGSGGMSEGVEGAGPRLWAFGGKLVEWRRTFGRGGETGDSGRKLNKRRRTSGRVGKGPPKRGGV